MRLALHRHVVRSVRCVAGAVSCETPSATLSDSRTAATSTWSPTASDAATATVTYSHGPDIVFVVVAYHDALSD
jgi:hypothetical protein